MLIHKDALAVSDVNINGDSRYFLHGALFDRKGRAIATNGHVLVRFTSNDVNADDFPTMGRGDIDISKAADVIIGIGDLKAAIAAMATRGTLPILDYMAIVPDDGGALIIATDLNHDVQIRTRKIDGQFPKTDGIMSPSAPVAGEMVINTETMEVVAKVARKLGVKSLHCTFYGKSTADIANNPILFKGDGTSGKLDGAFMAMRLP